MTDPREITAAALEVVLNASPPASHEEFSKRILDDFAAYYNPGFLAVRKSVTEAGDEAAIEWSGEGSIVTDVSGREWIDCLGGYGIYNLGVRHPEVVAAVEAQLHRSPLHTQELLDPLRGLLSEALVAATPAGLDRVFLCNSGTEAVEAALKLSMWVTGRHNFVSTENAFHGKTLGSLSLMGKEKYRTPFEPALIDCQFVPYNDAGALDVALAAADPKPAAFFVEPVQGEGGAIPPDAGYLRQVREICTKHGVLMVADEVQTGMGRTGKLFAIEHDGVVPDIMTLAKSLGGGVMPIGALMSSAEHWKVWEPNPFIHSNTFGGNPLSCAAAIAALHVTLRDDIPGQSARKGEYMLGKLNELANRFPTVLERATGQGLLIGMHFATDEIGYAVSAGLFRRGVLVAGTGTNAKAVRIEPALNIGNDLIEHVLDRLEDTLQDVASR